MPAPTIEPMTMAVREDSGSFCCSAEEATDDGADAAEDVIFSPLQFVAEKANVSNPSVVFGANVSSAAP
jgi:hypothetical protein